jgi:hypothetical protein
LIDEKTKGRKYRASVPLGAEHKKIYSLSINVRSKIGQRANENSLCFHAINSAGRNLIRTAFCIPFTSKTKCFRVKGTVVGEALIRLRSPGFESGFAPGALQMGPVKFTL